MPSKLSVSVPSRSERSARGTPRWTCRAENRRELVTGPRSASRRPQSNAVVEERAGGACFPDEAIVARDLRNEDAGVGASGFTRDRGDDGAAFTVANVEGDGLGCLERVFQPILGHEPRALLMCLVRTNRQRGNGYRRVGLDLCCATGERRKGEWHRERVDGAPAAPACRHRPFFTRARQSSTSSASRT